MADSDRNLYFPTPSAYSNGDGIRNTMPLYSLYNPNLHYPQPHHHRPSYPGSASRAPTNELDLSAYDAATSQINNVPWKELVKPIHEQQWTTASHSHSTLQRPQAPAAGYYASGPLKQGAMSDPTPNQDAYGVDLSSDNGTSEAGDSGYSSNMPTAIAEPASLNHSSINNSISNYDSHHVSWMTGLNRAAGHQRHPPQSIKSDSHLHAQPRDSRKGRSGKVPIRPCDVCGRKPKNLSDAKKHTLNHTKPYQCTEHGCSRKEGFSTVNDLQRHRKTVHKASPTVGSNTGFVCAACPPPEGSKDPKFWPRRDNFKAHVKRKHPQCDADELIASSSRDMRSDDIKTAPSTGRSSYPDSITTSNDRRRSRMSNGQNMMDPSRRASRPDDYSHPWPPSSAGEFSRADAASLLGGMGHAVMSDSTGLGPMELPSMADPAEANGLSILSDAAFEQGLTSFMTGTPPPDLHRAKRSRLSESNYYRGSEQDLQMAPVEAGSNVTVGSSETSGNQGNHSCSQCGKNIQRECDFKKHMKRHTRPYGCTFPRCYKRFGSRNDWKRHESSQHYLDEIWKCRRRCADGSMCAHAPFSRLEHVKKHLTNKHGLTDVAEINQNCADFRLGQHANDHFWCGFCGKLIEQDKSTPYAYAARFQHIGDHFDKGLADIDNWICIENEQPKGKMARTEQGEKEGTEAQVTGNAERKSLPMPGAVPPGFSDPVKTSTKLPATQGTAFTER